MRKSTIDSEGSPREPLATGGTTKLSSEQPPVVAEFACPSCGSKGYVFRKTAPKDKASEVHIYICSECGKRTEITAQD
jgi:DNA-directed RNA polymerase subunit RPC12/RpoP